MSRFVTLRDRLGIVAGIVALFFVSNFVADHFPQAYATEFYVAKALVGVAAVVVTIIHMDKAWGHLASSDQGARYLALFFGTVVAGASSVEQIKEHAAVELRNIGGAEFLLIVLVVMSYSLRQELRRVRYARTGARRG